MTETGGEKSLVFTPKPEPASSCVTDVLSSHQTLSETSPHVPKACAGHLSRSSSLSGCSLWDRAALSSVSPLHRVRASGRLEESCGELLLALACPL